MMRPMSPDQRRALRVWVHVIGALIMLGFLGWIIHKSPPDKLEYMGYGLIAILLLRELFHGAENVTARLKFSASPQGASAEVDPIRPR